MAPDDGHTEQQRLAAVSRYEILDTAPEQDFDNLVKLAAKIFGVSISTVTILDEHRQWFKASLGLKVRQTDRKISFCQHVVADNQMLVVEDTHLDERFSNNPLVRGEPHLRFYAGVPLTSSDNFPIGTLCIMDHSPRMLNEDEQDTLQMIASQAMKLLELRLDRNRLRDLLLERDKINRTLLESEQRWKFALEGAGDGVWDWHIQNHATVFSRRWKEMLGYQESELPNDFEIWRSLIHPDDFAKAEKALADYLNHASDVYTAEHRLRCKNGQWKWIMTRGMVVEWDSDGKPVRMVGTHTDISHLKESETLIWMQANYDTLTGLPNRRMFFDRLNEAIKRGVRSKKQFALLFLDLDGFKAVNDRLGHQAGDILLIELSKRMKYCIRESDTVARLGGDEFTIILSDLEEKVGVRLVAEKLLKALSQAVMLDEGPAQVTVSIGISLYPEDGRDSDILMSKADNAMYMAKARGKQCYVFAAEADLGDAQSRPLH
jgi:diguanylate cyclase (GGDEF)-like protein/PAS domain S-box-containing protein